MSATLLALSNDRIDPPSLHLLGMSARTDRRHRENARVLQGLDDALARRLREARDLDLLADEKLDPLHDVGLIGAHVDAKGLARSIFDLGDRLLQLTKRHRGCGQDAKASGLAGRRRKARTGHPAHPGLNDRVLDAKHVADAGVQRGLGLSWASWGRASEHSSRVPGACSCAQRSS